MTLNRPSLIQCPLSQSSQVKLLELLDTPTVIHLYRKILKIDVSEEFDQIPQLGFYHCSVSDLKFFYPAIAGSTSFYQNLQQYPWYYADEKEEYHYAKQFIRSGDRVLEIGCGKGAFAHHLIEQGISTQDYVGLEFSPDAQAMAQSQGLQVLTEPISDHAQTDPDRYNIVCAFQVLEHVVNPANFIRDSLQCLKTGGLLIFSVPSADSFIALSSNNMLNLPPHHVSWWSDQALSYVAQLFDLELVSLYHEPLAPIHLRWYAETLILQALRQQFAQPVKLLSQSKRDRLFSKVAYHGSKWLVKGLTAPEMLPRGHSVTVVYRKRG